MNRLLKNSILYSLLLLLFVVESTGQSNGASTQNADLSKKALKEAWQLIPKNPALAYEKTQAVIDWAIKYEEVKLEIDGFNQLAFLLQEVGLYQESLDCIYRALRTAERIRHEQAIERLLSNAARISFEMEDYEECLKTLEKHKDLKVYEQDSLLQLRVSLLEGFTWLEIDSLEWAEEALLNKNLKAFIEARPNFAFGYYLHLGQLYAKQNRLELALQAFEQGASLEQELEAHEELSSVKLEQAAVLERLNRLAEAESALLFAKKSSSSGSAKLFKQSVQQLAAFYARQNKPLRAYQIYNRNNDWVDSLESQEEARKQAVLDKLSEHQKLEDLTARLKAEQERTAALHRNQWLYVLTIILLIGVIVLYAVLQRDRQKRRKREYLLLRREVRRTESYNQELKDLNERLESSNALRDKMLSIISHELRSPIANLQSVLELMNSGMLEPDEERELRQSLAQELNGTTLLLENLLRWAKNQLKGLRFAPQTVSLNKLVNESLQLVERQAQRKSIQIQNTIPEELSVFVDVEMMGIVIKNLLTNAVKFTDKGGKVILSTEQASPQRLRVKITDTGRGMSEAEKERLFTLQIKSRLGTDAEPGTGLGLLLCREFVERNNGKIWVDTQEGKGSTFTFEIPAVPSPSFA